MKLIITGSTGNVATEVIKQALAIPAITSIIALARRETVLPQTSVSDTTKFKSVVCDDFLNFSESVKKELSGADACIWALAVTPSKSKLMPFEEARKICHDYTISGLNTIAELPRDNKPFRFIYVSGANTERDQTKKPLVLGDYCLMRGETENQVLDFAQQSNNIVEACVAKPGLVDAPGRRGILAKAAVSLCSFIISLPQIQERDLAATLLEQAVNGIEKDTLLNDDLIRIGQHVLTKQSS